MRAHGVAAVAFLVTGLGSASALAGEAPYPVRPLRLIVPFAPGGGTDLTSRLVSNHLSEALGRQVVVDNRAGGGGNVGAELAARAAPDGYTLCMAALSTAVNASLFRKLPFDVIRDFDPVSLFSSAPTLLVVHPSLPAQTFAELMAMARAKPGQLNYGSGGFGTANHVAGELFKYLGNVNITHVPYKGGGPALADLMAGQLHLVFATTTSTREFVRTGRLRALAITSLKRSPLLPDMPTVAESGIPGFEVLAWYGIMVPSGTPKAIVARLSTELQRAARAPEVRERFNAVGAEPVGTTAEEFGVFLRNEIDKWQKVVKASGLRTE
jgi:tripartite-type tricarboxylate transporter receptor subunit TctC